jgi:DnaJ-class molecular chaperone
MSHVHRHATAKRMPYDSDYGPYTGHPMDPRYDGDYDCADCRGEGGALDADDVWQECLHCEGSGSVDADGEPVQENDRG